jgi:hypothetical protein
MAGGMILLTLQLFVQLAARVNGFVSRPAEVRA